MKNITQTILKMVFNRPNTITLKKGSTNFLRTSWGGVRTLFLLFREGLIRCKIEIEGPPLLPLRLFLTPSLTLHGERSAGSWC